VLPRDDDATDYGTYAVSSRSLESVPEPSRIDLESVSLRSGR
jgi:hypothetical protein